ncbi:MAG: guanylate kinase [Candidatus Latescibacterota bacterium]
MNTCDKNGNAAGAEKLTGLLVVFSAPSGTGKTTVLREVLKTHPEMKFSVSVTTRGFREGEKDGVDYHFVSDKKFDELVAQDAFLEWAVVHFNRYGTLKSAVKEGLEKGEKIIFDTDTVGAFNIKKQFPDAVLIFIAPPSPEVLRERLKNRDTESPERMELRFNAAPGEMNRMCEYDYIVVNDSLTDTVRQVNSILAAESLRSWRVSPVLTEWRKYLHGKRPGNKGQ